MLDSADSCYLKFYSRYQLAGDLACTYYRNMILLMKYTNKSSFTSLFLRYFSLYLRFPGSNDMHEVLNLEANVLCILLTCVQGFASSFQLDDR